MTKLPISVVILTKNSEATILDCLESVSQNNPQEVVVVDGCSSDSTIDIVMKYTDRIYHDEGKGLCYARQLGAEMANEGYIAYVDSDVILPLGCLEQMLREMQAEGYAAICAQQLLSSKGPTCPGQMEQGANHSTAKNEGPRVTKVVDTRSAIFMRDLILGYKFDSSIPNCDVLDISYKLLRHGHKFGLSSALAYHVSSPTKRGVYWIGVAAGEFLWKYRSSPIAAMKYALPRAMGFHLYKMGVSARKGDFRGVHYLVPIAIQTAGFLRGLLGFAIKGLGPRQKSKEM